MSLIMWKIFSIYWDLCEWC